MNVESDIFAKGSRTFFWSSLFFPKHVRDDVTKLYSFVRIADDYVDEQPSQPKKLRALHLQWKHAQAEIKFDTTVTEEDSIDQRVVKNMVYLTRKYSFDSDWVEAFMTAMEQDINPPQHAELADSLDYVYGSAEVIGLMMAQIMGLPAQAHKAARYQGRAMQWVNFIRDVAEDNDLQRSYFPQADLKKFGLRDITQTTAEKHPDEFRAFMQFQIQRYRQWQATADSGMLYIPKRLRIPLKTAAHMYEWTAQQIEQDPRVVFQRKVKPTRTFLVYSALKNFIHG